MCPAPQDHRRVQEETRGEAAEGTTAPGKAAGGEDPQAPEASGKGEYLSAAGVENFPTHPRPQTGHEESFCQRTDRIAKYQIRDPLSLSLSLFLVLWPDRQPDQSLQAFMTFVFVRQPLLR